jgi:RNA polymerase sigma-70 factor (ECF subfamily)
MTDPVLPRIARGDRSAVQDCVDRYGSLVWSMALRWARRRADAEDCVQDIFIELWKVADRYDASRGSETTFIATVARRRLIDRRRQQHREQARFVAAGDLDLEQTPSTDHLRLEQCGEAQLARRALDQLPADRRRVLQLSIYEGMTHEQISAHTGMPVGTVKSHVRRGLQTVRNLLLGADESTGKGRAS